MLLLLFTEKGKHEGVTQLSFHIANYHASELGRKAVVH